MSLLDRGPHTLLVQLMKPGPKGPLGEKTRVPDGLPVSVSGAMVQPLTAAEATELGVRPDTSFRVIARSWPGGIYSEIVWDQDPVAGRTLFQRGEATVRSIGRRTRHSSALLVANSAEVK